MKVDEIMEVRNEASGVARMLGKSARVMFGVLDIPSLAVVVLLD